jgi:pyruvate dehydrogenase E2 component (dihydrolipoamide acetyltransferase)
MEWVRIPKLGQTVEEVVLTGWLKHEGDIVRQGEPLYTVQTDKAEIEVEAPASGTLRKILVPEGTEVPVFTVVAYIGAPEEALPESTGVLPSTDSNNLMPSDTRGSAEHLSTETPPTSSQPVASHAGTGPEAGTASKKKVSPRARKRAAELHINPEFVPGSGVGGRVMAEDVERAASALHTVPLTPAARHLAGQSGLPPEELRKHAEGKRLRRSDVEAMVAARQGTSAVAAPMRRVPLSPMRRVIAERMSRSKFTAPHYYVSMDLDMTAAKALRTALPFKVTYNDIFLYAAAQTLKEFPQVNARWLGDAIEEHTDVHLGMAVALPHGLIVPVIRDAHTLSLSQIAEAARALAEKAAHGKLLPDDYSGNTFTVSNLGGYGVTWFTAIINPPDSAILAVGAVEDRVVAWQGGIHVRPRCTITLSSDHRVIDGAVAAQFLAQFKRRIESVDPTSVV